MNIVAFVVLAQLFNCLVCAVADIVYKVKASVIWVISANLAFVAGLVAGMNVCAG